MKFKDSVMSTKKKENSNGDHPTPDSTTKEKPSFSIGDEVLMQRKDGNFYLGTVVKIDLSREQCLVKFDDNTETWSSFTKLTKLSTGLEIMCVKCKVSQTETENDIVICDKCSRGYHQKCHYPEISDEYLKEDAKWECVRCSDVPEKRTLPLRKSTAGAPLLTPTTLPPPSAQSTPKPLPHSPKNSPQAAKPSPSPSSKPPTLSTKSSPTALKPPPQAPKSSPQSPKPSPQATKTASPPSAKPPTPVAKPISSGAKPPPQTSKPPQQTVKPSVPGKPAPPAKSQQAVSKPTPPTKPSPPPAKATPPPPPAKATPPLPAKATPPLPAKATPPPLAKATPPPPAKATPPPTAKATPPPPPAKATPPPPPAKATPPPPPAKATPPPPAKATPPPPPAKVSPSPKPLTQTHLFPSEPQPKSTTTPPTPPSTPTESVCSAIPVATDAQKKKLPYNLNDLHWYLHHRSNAENKYCYCGGPGKWFLKMLQCGRCKQWFHGRCLSSLRYSLFYGDRFYVFLCTLCNSGKEFLRRLEVKWIDLVHLAIFNLTLKTAKKYVDIDEDILGFINKSWNELQLPPKILETTSDSERREIVLSVLTGNRNKFKAAREVKSRKTKWGLRVRVPPPTPVFSLPPNKPLSDQVLSDAWHNSARLKFLPPPPRNSLPSKPEDDFDLSNLKDQLPGVDILHIETRMLVLPKGVPASGHNVCIKSSTPMYPESRAIKRRIKEQAMENDRLRRSRKARRLLRSSLSKEREKSEEEKERQDLPPTPPSSESNPEAAPSAQPESSGDETSSRGTLDSIIPPPADFSGSNNPFLPLQPVLRPVKRKLSEKDIIVTSTGEVKRRKIRRSRLLAGRGSTEGVAGGRGKVKRLKSANSTPTPTTSPVKNSPPLTLEELKSSVNQYFGAVNRINSGEDFVVMAKRIGFDGRTQYLINWGTPT